MHSGQDMDLEGGTVDINGAATSERDLTIVSTSGDVTNIALVTAAGNIDMTSAGKATVGAAMARTAVSIKAVSTGDLAVNAYVTAAVNIHA